jgi:hypothetical protein
VSIQVVAETDTKAEPDVGGGVEAPEIAGT